MGVLIKRVMCLIPFPWLEEAKGGTCLLPPAFPGYRKERLKANARSHILKSTRRMNQSHIARQGDYQRTMK